MDDGHDGGGGRRWGTILLAVLALAGAAVIAVLVWQTVSSGTRRDDAAALQRQSYGVMILARELDATLASAEATLGRFVISGDKRIGQTYADEWRRAGTLVDRLLRDANPAVRPQAKELRTAYLERGTELGAVALRTTYRQNDQALSKYYLAGKSPTLDRLKAAVDGLIARERATLGERTAEAEQTIARSNAMLAILMATGVLLAIIAGVLAFAAWLARQRRRDEEARALDLEDAVAARTAELHAEMAEREEAEAKLRQAHKMEAIGQLTGGIAHDFNNMLAVVVGGIELAQRRIAQGTGDAARHLDRAMEGAVRAAALTKRLLAFARAEPLLPVAVDPQALITNMVELLDRTLGDSIEIAIDGSARWPVFVDVHQLENALLNLAVNARDAMPAGGTLTIATRDAALSDGEVPRLGAGDYICISVTDTGLGMDEATIDRAFEPFFTTKAHGQGTGLGLSQAFGFVRQSGGSIAIGSTPGTGTTISLYLPRHTSGGALTLASSDRTPQTDPAPRGRPVLVIEDDPRVLAATAGALAELGHEPLPCATPAEVPAILRARRDIGLIVSDVQMPGITGPDLVAAIRELHPNIPVLFMTGFAGDIGDAVQFEGSEVLRKPFTLTTLAAALARALDEGRIEHAEAA
jgi:signal transduction histidine kinase/ActR/RegA family two-component response regulator